MIGTVTIIPFMPDGWDAAAGFPAMKGNVAFLMKDVVLLATSFYLLKQDVVRAARSADERSRGGRLASPATGPRGRWQPHGSTPRLSGRESRTTASVELRFPGGDIRYPAPGSPAGGGQGPSHVLVGVSRTEPSIYTDRSGGFVRRHAGCVFLVPFAD